MAAMAQLYRYYKAKIGEVMGERYEVTEVESSSKSLRWLGCGFLRYQNGGTLKFFFVIYPIYYIIIYIISYYIISYYTILYYFIFY